MELKKLAMVTIIAETLLEEDICTSILELGATGFTVVESRGQGSFGRNTAEVPGTNVRIETIVDPEVAKAIMAGIAKDYFEHYSVITFISEVSVLRDGKYNKK